MSEEGKYMSQEEATQALNKIKAEKAEKTITEAKEKLANLSEKKGVFGLFKKEHEEVGRLLKRVKELEKKDAGEIIGKELQDLEKYIYQAEEQVIRENIQEISGGKIQYESITFDVLPGILEESKKGWEEVKKELETKGREHGIELDRRHSKEDLIDELEAGCSGCLCVKSWRP